jgi:REP element-mobilizing transposase RayT
MDEIQSLRHAKWECKYHVVFIPKCRHQRLVAPLITLEHLAAEPPLPVLRHP